MPWNTAPTAGVPYHRKPGDADWAAPGRPSLTWTEPGGGGTPAHLLPFSATSPWRLGIADTATFPGTGDARNVSMQKDVGVAGKVWVNFEQYSHPIAYGTAGDPLATVTDSFHSPTDIPPGGSWQVRVPATARIAAGFDQHMHVISPDLSTAYEHFYVTRNSTTSYTTTRRHAVSLAGSGLGPQNGTRAYGGSALGGLIRRWEIDPAHPDYTGEIRHALAISLRADQLYFSGTILPDDGHGGMYRGDGYGRVQGYVWPATEQDAGSESNYTGSVPMGAYFAIPPGVNVAGLGLNAAGTMVAKACQDYGVYVTDRSGAAAFYIEDDNSAAAGNFAGQLIDAPNWNANTVRAIFQQLRYVSNNAAATPNGGVIGATRRGV